MGARAVTCPDCGASTAPPADLREPTFACAGCGRALSTAGAVGAPVVEAHGFVRELEAAMAGGPSAPTRGLDHGAAPPRPGTCLRCRAAVSVPMDLRVREFTCAACGCTQPVVAHVSDADRMATDFARQVAENERLRALRADGVPCPQCGGQVSLAAGAVSATCGYCGAVVAAAAFAGAHAVAREQLAHGVRAAIESARAEHATRAARRDRLILAFVAVFVTLMLGGFACSSVLTGVAAALR